MKQKNNYYTKKHKKKKQGKTLTITLLISGIVMTGLLVWLGLNDWNVGKSMKKAQEVIGMSVPEEDDNTAEPDEKAEPVKEQGGTSEQKPAEQTPSNPAGDDNAESGTAEKPEPSIDNGGYVEGQQLPEEPKYINEILIANKKYPLPKTYAPGEDKEARAAFEKMAAEAKLSQFNLTAFSTYRSFDYQTTLYERYVARDGKEAADTYSARPGYSEHQTGLAFDIGEVNFEQHFASASFGETEAGKWVAMNAHRFGFIMRYPAGKEHVTGYMHESWHFRYVGTEIATEIYNRKITLEEYLGI
ncbi:D-alanyl-D-alanine carboxypeptidase family protein [Sporosarcina sp. JAI121]|uniref:M15 family metallopeptidase n=1 Tax=Sporosarcina sp. JAI121 TaxID=2723064 RepID=UPI0015CC2FB9|nr:M15 family metallopeptidase [Sporosarcina sp. JAI121]NYF25938.1 D-alanyl-D-alanine carboxypeptidase [Sporosarcina sp. JAI121]